MLKGRSDPHVGLKGLWLLKASDKICVLMLLATGGGSKARVFGGMGRGMAEDREKEGRACEGEEEGYHLALRSLDVYLEELRVVFEPPSERLGVEVVLAAEVLAEANGSEDHHPLEEGFSSDASSCRKEGAHTAFSYAHFSSDREAQSLRGVLEKYAWLFPASKVKGLDATVLMPLRADSSVVKWLTLHYTVPVSPRCLQGTVLPTPLPLVLQDAVVPAKLRSQCPPRDITALGCSSPPRRSLDKSTHCEQGEVKLVTHCETIPETVGTQSHRGVPTVSLFVTQRLVHSQGTMVTMGLVAFAIDEINKNPNLLPNITLGYHLYDNCVRLGMAFRAAISLISGTEKSFSNLNCTGPPPVVGIVGDPSSTPSIAISSVLGLFRVPIVSYYATCSCLSDRKKYPSFFRTIPSDAFQVRAMIQILRHFGWTWVGLIYSDDDYGVYAAQSFQQEMQLFGHCVAFSEILPHDNNPRDIQHITGVIRASTARVVVVFSTSSFLLPLMEEVVSQNMTGRQWIASEAWATSPVYHTPRLLPFLGGTLGIAVRRGKIQGLHDFLLRIRPSNEPRNNMLRIFWENMFGCSYETGGTVKDGEQVKNVCTGEEDLITTNTPYTDVSGLRAAYNVYKAVYALAHALHDLMQCEEGRGPFSGNSCADITNLKPWQLVHYLQKVNFTTGFGDHVSFDKNGDALAIYDVLNWQPSSDGSIRIYTVGVVSEGVTTGIVLTLDEDAIYWNFETKKPPRSVCSESCPPGTRRATRKGLPVCCFDCLPCGDGEISNTTDAIECTTCPDEFWSSPDNDQCVPKEVEFLSYEDPLGISLTTASLLGTCFCALVMIVFTLHRNTPIVRANNSELSFLLLVSLKMCFLCVLLFIGQPQLWTCQLRHAVFGISFVLCISSILVKTMVVIAVFKSSRPEGKGAMKWFGAVQQRCTVLVLTALQVVICAVWLSTASPTPHKNNQYIRSKIVYECAIGSVAGFSMLLGYIGLLAAVSFLLAFLARNLPDNFNETKFITFSMLIFCAVWIAFVPAYVSSPGKYAVAVEIFAILASSFGLLVAIFAPKCYIILLHPERNTKNAIMGRETQKK
ncbi:extracellular calcium-sensing receptor-like [Sinocyclocheilus anshuiensis]|nr:PREDICTED: extracellular calcium-sensing receptor-like [Sinocyclocheilus anshuiensis]